MQVQCDGQRTTSALLYRRSGFFPQHSANSLSIDWDRSPAAARNGPVNGWARLEVRHAPEIERNPAAAVLDGENLGTERFGS